MRRIARNPTFPVNGGNRGKFLDGTQWGVSREDGFGSVPRHDAENIPEICPGFEHSGIRPIGELTFVQSKHLGCEIDTFVRLRSGRMRRVFRRIRIGYVAGSGFKIFSLLSQTLKSNGGD